MVTYVILGYKLKKNGKIHPILKKRLDFFLKKYKKGDTVILSGGNNNKKIHSEAYIMSKYIKENIDIEKQNIILENRSNDTIQNIFYTFNILKKRNIKKIYIITSIWHLKRVKMVINFFNERNIKIKLFGSKKLFPKNKSEVNSIKNEIAQVNFLKYSFFSQK